MAQILQVPGQKLGKNFVACVMVMNNPHPPFPNFGFALITSHVLAIEVSVLGHPKLGVDRKNEWIRRAF